MYVYVEVQTLLINGRTALRTEQFLITPPEDLEHWNNTAGGVEFDKLCPKACSEMPSVSPLLLVQLVVSGWSGPGGPGAQHTASLAGEGAAEAGALWAGNSQNKDQNKGKQQFFARISGHWFSSQHKSLTNL